ncbi:hypothetical protein E8E95_00560 [Pseudomonas sp. BN414]|uniref:hypothetical protein n=1 Tax=Pseudomonas sp. BN414 TaxID=2567888 RepID=UPI002454B582|nr:hypothetical protein [Pseudomonas sp. BN414]MDH4565176.1 hypothetical protein [Pseudomonas sp. BN414]
MTGFGAVERTDLSDNISRIRASRDRGVRWILDRVDSSGKPVGADERNGWARVPWALAVSGEASAAAQVVAWAERTQLTLDGSFAPGPALGTGRFLAYPLAHFAIGAWFTERFDVATAVMGALRQIQDPNTGGFPIAPPQDRSTDFYDLLSTAQVGQAAVITGQDDIADGVYRWVTDLLELQPANAGNRLYTFRHGRKLLEQPSKELEWLAITDFNRARQTYYTPGMAAVFLSAYAQRNGLKQPLNLASDLLAKNLSGTPEQFNDLGSVQLCKFGWGAAALAAVDIRRDWTAHLTRMVNWFEARQAADGSWAPSSFLQPSPTDIDRLIKTAEHVMEVNAILGALGAAGATRAGR